MEDTKSPDSEGKAEVADRFRVMELRSERRVRRSPPPRRLRSRRGPCGGADDRLSALPDDMLLLVLARLRCARSAARTGILSRRWRDLWTLLPDLTFCDVAPAKVEVVLARLASSPSVSATLDIDIPRSHCGDGARLVSLLDAVARFSPRELRFSYQFDMGTKAADLHLPCFPRATSIEFDWHTNSCFMQLPDGEFSALERLSLGGASVIDIDTLLTRCPRLRVLSVDVSTSDIKVHSVSLQTLDVLSEQVCISSIDIVTPKLKQLELIFGANTDLSVSISAPMVEKVVWNRGFTETTLLFGFWSLRIITLRPTERLIYRYYWREEDTCSQLTSVHVLYLELSATDELYDELDMAQEVEFAQEMEKLPVTNFSVLHLSIQTGGHVFGALVCRLLGLHQRFAVIKRLIVDIEPWYSGRRPCSQNCPCDELKNWRCQNISLTRLDDVHIDGFTGEDLQLDFLKLIFRSSPMLKRVTLKLVPKFEGCTKKIYNTFLAYPHVKGYVYLSSGELVPQPSD